MAIAFAQVRKLLTTITTVVPDALDCDGCFALSAELAEIELRGGDLSDVLKSVRVHMSQCPCCKYEYEALLEAVRAAEEQS